MSEIRRYNSTRDGHMRDSNGRFQAGDKHPRRIAVEMTDMEFIDFMKDITIAPDTVIKKAHMNRAIDMIATLTARIKELTEALEMLAGHDDKFVSEIVKAALEEKP